MSDKISSPLGWQGRGAVQPPHLWRKRMGKAVGCDGAKAPALWPQGDVDARPWPGPSPTLRSLAVPSPASDGSCLPLALPSSAQCAPVSGEAGRGVFTPCLPQGAGRAAAGH